MYVREKETACARAHVRVCDAANEYAYVIQHVTLLLPLLLLIIMKIILGKCLSMYNS